MPSASAAVSVGTPLMRRQHGLDSCPLLHSCLWRLALSGTQEGRSRFSRPLGSGPLLFVRRLGLWVLLDILHSCLLSSTCVRAPHSHVWVMEQWRDTATDTTTTSTTATTSTTTTTDLHRATLWKHQTLIACMCVCLGPASPALSGHESTSLL